MVHTPLHGEDIWIEMFSLEFMMNKKLCCRVGQKRARGSNKIRFLVLRDSTGFIQCVAKKDIVGETIFEAIASALIETSVVVHGKVRAEERAPGGHEIDISNFEIVGEVNPETPFPITESAMKSADGGETEFLLDNHNLYLRTSRMTNMLKNSLKCIWGHPPLLPKQRILLSIRPLALLQEQ